MYPQSCLLTKTPPFLQLTMVEKIAVLLNLNFDISPIWMPHAHFTYHHNLRPIVIHTDPHSQVLERQDRYCQYFCVSDWVSSLHHSLSTFDTYRYDFIFYLPQPASYLAS